MELTIKHILVYADNKLKVQYIGGLLDYFKDEETCKKHLVIKALI